MLYNLLTKKSQVNICLEMQVPKEWKLDPKWEGEPRPPEQLSHLRKFPSKWRAISSKQDPINTVRIVDRFDIPRTKKPEESTKEKTWLVKNLYVD